HVLPMLNCVNLPAGLDEAAARKTLLHDHGVEVGGGLGAFAGKCWRIGLMGHGAHPENVERIVTAIDAVM
ncbi:MAG: alanine--glyoxylate aminotransferase family protein, partial [Planctomycetota bacterium]